MMHKYSRRIILMHTYLISKENVGSKVHGSIDDSNPAIFPLLDTASALLPVQLFPFIIKLDDFSFFALDDSLIPAPPAPPAPAPAPPPPESRCPLPSTLNFISTRGL